MLQGLILVGASILVISLLGVILWFNDIIIQWYTTVISNKAHKYQHNLAAIRTKSNHQREHSLEAWLGPSLACPSPSSPTLPSAVKALLQAPVFLTLPHLLQLCSKVTFLIKPVGLVQMITDPLSLISITLLSFSHRTHLKIYYNSYFLLLLLLVCSPCYNANFPKVGIWVFLFTKVPQEFKRNLA